MGKIYYGWVIVAVAFLIGATEAGAMQNILAVFLKPMADAFGWSRTEISATMLFGSLVGGFVSPIFGPLIDRHGARLVAFFSVLVMSAGLVSLYFLNHLWQLYVFFGIGRVVAVGILTLVLSVTVSNWFIRLRGRAMGIVWLGPRIGAAILPAFVQYFIFSQGWRFAWVALGTVVFLASGIPSLLFLRRRPEDMGLLPDGDTKVVINHQESPQNEKAANDSDSISNPEPAWTRKQAFHTRAFWLLTLINCVYPLIQAGTNFHLYPFMTDQGISESFGIVLLSTFAVTGSVGAFLCGILSERYGSKTLLIINGFGSGLVFFAFYITVTMRIGGTSGAVIVFVLQILNGFLHGGRQPLLYTIWADYFGRHSLGSIQSLSGPFKFAANAAGPILTALFYDIYGSYATPFCIFIFLYFVAGVLSLYLTAPKQPEP